MLQIFMRNYNIRYKKYTDKISKEFIVLIIMRWLDDLLKFIWYVFRKVEIYWNKEKNFSQETRKIKEHEWLWSNYLIRRREMSLTDYAHVFP